MRIMLGRGSHLENSLSSLKTLASGIVNGLPSYRYPSVFYIALITMEMEVYHVKTNGIIAFMQLTVFHPVTMTGFFRKWDKDEAPSLEDGSSFKRPGGRSEGEADPFKLEEKFYRYGVNPDWLAIWRVVAHE